MESANDVVTAASHQQHRLFILGISYREISLIVQTQPPREEGCSLVDAEWLLASKREDISNVALIIAPIMLIATV